MTREQCLLTLKCSIIALPKDKVAELLVDLLDKHDSLYHFDDDPSDILDGNKRPEHVFLFNETESFYLKEIVNYCYSEKLFEFSLRKVGL